MEFTESTEHSLIRETVRSIGSSYGHEYYVEQAKSGGKMEELWQDLAKNGFLGVNTPEEYGGEGAGISELAIVCEELARQGCRNLFLIVTPAICASVIGEHGSEEQKRKWLPAMASGEIKMAFAMTEPDAGSNTHKLATRAEKVEGGYRIRGTKYYISGVDESAALLLVARTGEALSLFVVPTDVKGLEATPIPVEMVSSEKQFTLFFDDLLVGEESLVGELGRGFQQVFSGLNPERITGAAVVNGIGLYALDKAAQYACDRVVWDRPIGAHQGLAHPLAVAKIEVELARLMTSKAAWLYDQGLEAGEAANMAKYAGAESAARALDQAIQTHGGNGLASEYGPADLWGVTKLFRLAPVSREMILNFVAQHSLGLPKSY